MLSVAAVTAARLLSAAAVSAARALMLPVNSTGRSRRALPHGLCRWQAVRPPFAEMQDQHAAAIGRQGKRHHG